MKNFSALVVGISIVVAALILSLNAPAQTARQQEPDTSPTVFRDVEQPAQVQQTPLTAGRYQMAAVNSTAVGVGSAQVLNVVVCDTATGRTWTTTSNARRWTDLGTPDEAKK
jgi:hypothetical protein